METVAAGVTAAVGEASVEEFEEEFEAAEVEIGVVVEAEAEALVQVRAPVVEEAVVVKVVVVDVVGEEDPAMTSWVLPVVGGVEGVVRYVAAVEVVHCYREEEEGGHRCWVPTFGSFLQSLLHYRGRRRRYDHYEGPVYPVVSFPGSRHRNPRR